MWMIIESLTPGMEDLDNTRNSAEKFFVSSKLEDRFCGAFMDEIIEQSLIGIKQEIQFGRNGKDKMVIGTVYDLIGTVYDCCAANYLQLLKSDYPQLNKEKSMGLFKI